MVGSKIVSTIYEAKSSKEGIEAAEKFCTYLSGRGEIKTTREVGMVEAVAKSRDAQNGMPQVSAVVKEGDVDAQERELAEQIATMAPDLTGRFGEFGGKFVPESLMTCLEELERGFEAVRNDESFWEEYRSYYEYMGRPGHFHRAERLTEHAGGADIWLKREDLNHTGSHKINNALGQFLVAKRLGKTEIIAETGAGQHGVATATVCAKFGMKCTVFMGGVSFLFSVCKSSY